MPAPAPAPGITPPPPPAVSGAVVYKALTAIAPDDNPTETKWVGYSTQGDRFTVYQLAGRSRTYPEPTYLSYSWYFETAGDEPPSSILHATWLTPNGDNNPGLIDVKLTDNQTDLFRSEPFGINQQQNYQLDTTLAEWRPTTGTWFAKLILQSHDASTFRLCWHAQLPGLLRLWCGKYARQTGDHVGIYVIDDSPGFGRKTWDTPQ